MQQQLPLTDAAGHRLDGSSNMLGWTVRRCKDGYLRGYRRVAGKVACVYFGKNLLGAADKIEAKISRLVDRDNGR